MEKSINLISEHFPMAKEKLRSYSALSLAYVGDDVYDLIIRTMVMSKGNNRPNNYHHQTTGYVKAEAQAKMMEEIKPVLDEEEQNVFRRGRNSKSISPAKNQSKHDYRIATGFEALMGYLYLAGRMDRVLELVEIGLRCFEEEK